MFNKSFLNNNIIYIILLLIFDGSAQFSNYQLLSLNKFTVFIFVSEYILITFNAYKIVKYVFILVQIVYIVVNN